MHFKFLCENTLNTIFQQTSRPLHYCLMYTSGVKLNILFYIVHCWMCYINISIVWFSSSEFGVSVFGRGFHRIRFFGFNQELLFWCIPYWLWSSDASKWNNVNIKKCFPHRLQLFYPAAWAQLRLTQSISCRKPTSSYGPVTYPFCGDSDTTQLVTSVLSLGASVHLNRCNCVVRSSNLELSLSWTCCISTPEPCGCCSAFTLSCT